MSKKITTQVNKLPDSRVEITVTIPIDIVMNYQKPALKKLQDTITIDGFRKGHIPESTLIEKVGHTGLLAEMADLALTDKYTEIIEDAKTQPISRPEITVTKLAPDNDVEFIITTDVMPVIEINDVINIAKKQNSAKESVTVTDEDIAKAIKEIRQMRAHDKMHEDGIDHHDHNHQNIPDEKLPELDDAFVQSLGKFDTVADFTEKIKENILLEKEKHEQEKHRITMIEKIIASGTFEIPVSMIDFELHRMIEQMKYDLAMSGMKFEEYLGHINKTVDEIKIEWKDQAKKRVQTQLSLEKIAEEFSITPDQEKIDAQVAQMMEMYKDQSVDESNIVAYVTQMMTNTAVFEWLESQK
jgi:FKBP-type peptidyl-prolyl cis-trans isomerase (trigger factor)